MEIKLKSLFLLSLFLPVPLQFKMSPVSRSKVVQGGDMAEITITY